MRNLDKYLSILNNEVDGLLLTVLNYKCSDFFCQSAFIYKITATKNSKLIVTKSLE